MITARRLRVDKKGPGDIADTQSIDAIKNPLTLAQAVMYGDGAVSYEEMEYRPYLRCSGLHNVCLREQVLGWRTDKKVKISHRDSMQVTFDIGNAFHEYLQNSPKYLGRKRLGWWQCTACGWTVFSRKWKQPCKRCGASNRAFRHKEHSMVIRKPFRLTGHPDDFLEVGPGDIRTLELKSIEGEAFKKLRAPLGDHVIQVHGYMVGLKYDATLPIKVNIESALIVYVTKKMVQGLPFKAFHVRRTPAIEQTVLHLVEKFTKAIEEKDYLPGPLPECSRSTFGSGRPRRCPLRKECVDAL
jgi:hypothetical protein